MTNPVIDRAMRAAFKAWQDEMVHNGKTSVLNAKFDDIAPRDRRLIELQCRAAIASLLDLDGEPIQRGTDVRCNGDATWEEGNETRSVFRSIIDAALKDS